MQRKYPEISREIEAIEASLMNYAEENTKLPSEHLKNKIQQQLFTSQPAASVKPEAKVVQMSVSENKAAAVLRFAVAASFALLIASAAFNFVLYHKLHSANQELAELHSEKEVMAGQYKIQQTALSEKSDELAMIIKPGNKMVMLKGIDVAPQASAMIVWNTINKSVYIDAATLPMPPEGKQYQLWALVNGKPVDAGVFTMQDGKFVMQKMKDMPDNAQAYAVTLEKMGGSAVPTMDAMYLIGNV
ncbi:MAG: hypothetical protein JWP12_3713 [Bacteroidetes bacterium]|nr:hypothetical protein [Bacteroidota bacterium]